MSLPRGAAPQRPVQRSIPTAHIQPNPYQPRHRLGNLAPLVRSVREHGLLQPLLVRRIGAGRFQIIAGERRFRAARMAGLREVPCLERAASRAEILELGLIENLIREDLTPFEEAHAYAALVREHGHTHQSLADRVGALTEQIVADDRPEHSDLGGAADV